MTTRVLVCIGDEEIPDAALLYAAHVAGRDDGVIRLLHVIPDRVGTSAQVHPLLDFGAVQLVGEQLVETAEERVRSLGIDSLRVETGTVTGSTVQELLTASESVDLVVLQHRLLSRLRRLFTGSVTVGVAKSCSVPVVSVPEFWLPWPDHNLRVTVGISEVGGQRSLLEHAFTRASREAVELDVLHAWYIPTAYDAAWAESASTRRWESDLHEELAREVSTIGTDFPDVKVTTRVVRDRPADALVAASRTSGLVVVQRTTGPGRSHLGWVTRTLLREASCPVEVFPVDKGTNETDRARTSRDRLAD